MREKKGGALQKLKKRLSHSFGRLSMFQFVLSLHCFFYHIDLEKSKHLEIELGKMREQKFHVFTVLT